MILLLTSSQKKTSLAVSIVIVLLLLHSNTSPVSLYIWLLMTLVVPGYQHPLVILYYRERGHHLRIDGVRDMLLLLLLVSIR